MDVTFETKVLLELSAVQIYEIKGKDQKLIQQGTLQVLEIEKFGLTFLKLADFQFPVQKNITVMTQPVVCPNGLPLKMYVLPSMDKSYHGLIIDQTQKDLSKIIQSIEAASFEYILADHCNLVQPEHAEVKSDGQHHDDQNKLGAWNNVGAGQKKGVSDYIVKGGELFKEGLISGAKVLSKGVVSGGHYIASKITTKDDKHIDPTTLKRVQQANSCVKFITPYTKVQIEALITMGKMLGEEAGKQFSESETGKELQQHKDYDEAKHIGKASLNALANMYDGLYQALSELGGSCAKATTEIINAKYGDQAGQLSGESFDLAGNIGHIAYMPEELAAKAVIQGTNPDTH